MKKKLAATGYITAKPSSKRKLLTGRLRPHTRFISRKMVSEVLNEIAN